MYRDTVDLEKLMAEFEAAVAVGEDDGEEEPESPATPGGSSGSLDNTQVTLAKQSKQARVC